MCAATICFEGEEDDVRLQEAETYKVIKQYNGMSAGAESGRKGYFMTFMIAYLRDFAFDFYFMSESFETCVPWSSVCAYCEDVEYEIEQCALQLQLKKKPYFCCRLTQMYETSACIYVYFGIDFKDIQNPKSVFHELEKTAVRVMLLHGASLSHHHGIGKHRSAWINDVVSNVAVVAMKNLKSGIDPTNNIGCKNVCPSMSEKSLYSRL